MRIFVRMRKLIATNQDILEKIEKLEAENAEQNDKISIIYETIKKLIGPSYKDRKRIGF